MEKKVVKVIIMQGVIFRENSRKVVKAIRYFP